MSLKGRLSIRMATVFLLAATAIDASSDQQWFGGTEDLEFAADLWSSMEQAGLLTIDSRKNVPRVGMHPHGALLESYKHSLAVNGTEGTVVLKYSYRGYGAATETVVANRDEYIDDITVMFLREEGYDTPNQNWFYAKYHADGSLDATPNGVELAGRIAKGKPTGCIACHRRAGDYLFAF